MKIKVKNFFGMFCEQQACHYLKQKGYTIIKNNYRYKKSEIDIIAKYKNTLVFIEVKGRKNAHFGFPETFVDINKENLVLKGADNFIFEIQWEKNIRFDIISIIGDKKKYVIKHFEDVFC